MSNLAVKQVHEPIKIDVTRIEAIFHSIDPYKSAFTGIIKDYVYLTQKRVIL